MLIAASVYSVFLAFSVSTSLSNLPVFPVRTGIEEPIGYTSSKYNQPPLQVFFHVLLATQGVFPIMTTGKWMKQI